MNTQSADTARSRSKLEAAASRSLSLSRLTAVGALALLFAATSAIASAHPGGGGGGGGSHGGGGHPAAGGGGAHFSGGGHYGGGAAAYRASPRFSYGSRGGSFSGGFVSRAPAYAPARSGTFAARTGIAPRAPIANGNFSGSRGYGSLGGAGGFHYRPWGGGYWRGRYWPAVYYGADFAWFLPVLPAYCVPYWWGGIPYYYYNDAYYTWDAGDGGYVASEPPPVADDSGADGVDGAAPPPSSDAGPGDGGYGYGAPGYGAPGYGAPGYGAQAPYPPAPGAGTTDPNAAAATAGSAGEAEQGAPIPDMSGNLYAYPKNGQSAEQQSADRRACAEWAAAQSPETAGGSSIDYKRALTACLTGRGYSVD